MCNACGFFCCALDTFDSCGCEGCPNSECWDDDWEDEYEYSDDDGLFEAASKPARRLVCEAVSPTAGGAT